MKKRPTPERVLDLRLPWDDPDIMAEGFPAWVDIGPSDMNRAGQGRRRLGRIHDVHKDRSPFAGEKVEEVIAIDDDERPPGAAADFRIKPHETGPPRHIPGPASPAR